MPCSRRDWVVVVFVVLTTQSVFGVTAESQPVDEITCPVNDVLCEKDKLGFDAIRTLHQKIDDDKDGKVDLSESDEYIRDEMKFDVDGSERHKSFHGNDDMISVEELWKLWIHSEVYNWTVEETTDWLVNHVELAQYAEKFKVNVVDGRTLPRLAANNHHYMSSILGIKNPINKQKLSFKATDVVLFGAPKKGHNYMKDLALVASMVIAVGGCWLAYVQNRYSQSHLKKVMKDLDNLQKAEDALTNLQNKLEEAQSEQKSAVQEKQHLEDTMSQEINQVKDEAERLRKMRETTEEEMSSLRLAEEELKQVRILLVQAERELQERPHAPLMELQQWLQLTYELETRHYDAKREAAERQMFIAKEMCEKIRKKRAAFLGSLRIAHSTSIDDTDQKILNARSAMEDVKLDLQERSNRWQQIEKICGFNIIHNPGLAYLESMLRVSGHSMGSNLMCSRQLGDTNSVASYMDDYDDDVAPNFASTTAINTAGLSVPDGRERRYPSVAAALGSSVSLQPPILNTMTPNKSTNNMLLNVSPAGLVRPLSARCMRDVNDPSADIVPIQRLRLDSDHRIRQNTDKVPSDSLNSGEVATNHTTSTDQHGQDRANGRGSTINASVTGSNGVVFQLGETESESKSQQQESPPVTTTSLPITVYKKSTSLDQSIINPLPRPKSLPKALSESAMKQPVILNNIGSSVSGAVKAKVPGLTKRLSSSRLTPPVTDIQEENSSPESTDNVSLNGEKKEKKKKRKIFLPKLLKRDSESKKSS